MSEQYRWGPHVECTDVEGSWLIMDPESMTMTKLDDVSAFVWSQLQTYKTKNELVNHVVTEFDVSLETADADLSSLLQELLDMRILEYRPTVSSVAETLP